MYSKFIGTSVSSKPQHGFTYAAELHKFLEMFNRGNPTPPTTTRVCRDATTPSTVTEKAMLQRSPAHHNVKHSLDTARIFIPFSKAISTQGQTG